MSDTALVEELLAEILGELRTLNKICIAANTPQRFLVNNVRGTWDTETKEVKPQPSMDPAWDKSPEEIRRIQALPNHSRIPSKPGFERDYTAYHAADTVYPYGRQV